MGQDLLLDKRCRESRDTLVHGSRYGNGLNLGQRDQIQVGHLLDAIPGRSRVVVMGILLQQIFQHKACKQQ